MHPRGKTTLQRIVVVCDGLPDGDSALHLAAGIARSSVATIRAVTWLTPAVARAAASMDKAPIEELLDRVTQQLYRHTKNPGFWRLALVTGDFAPAIARIVREEHADCVILPGRHISHDLATRVAWATVIPVATVFGTIGADDYHVRITTVQTAASQRLARLAESVIALVFRRESGAVASTPAPVEIRTSTTVHAPAAATGDEDSFSTLN